MVHIVPRALFVCKQKLMQLDEAQIELKGKRSTFLSLYSCKPIRERNCQVRRFTDFICLTLFYKAPFLFDERTMECSAHCPEKKR